MKLHLRWQILLAGLGFILVLAILSFQVQTTALCTTAVPAPGGVFTEGVVGAPQYLNPLLSDPNPVDRELASLIFDGLTEVDAAGIIRPALAESWAVSEDGRMVEFTLRDNAVWQDGEPVTTADVAFTYSLLQSEAFPGPPALSALWQSVTINPIDEKTISFSLSQPYAPFLEATSRGILPAHLLDGVSAAELPDHPFNLQPVGTGPWQVSSADDWLAARRLQLAPNPAWWREGTQISTLEFRFYPDAETVLAAFQAGEIHAINQVSPSILPALAALPDARLFTAVAPRYTALLFNTAADPANPLQSVEMRQALAYAADRQALIDEQLQGQGVAFEGPYLPSSWAYNPGELTAYTHDPLTATARFEAAGWVLPEGQTVRQREGVPLNIRLLTIEAEPYLSLAQGLQAQWAAVHASTTLSTAVTPAGLRQALAGGQFDVALVDVSPTADPDLYDFWSQEAMIRGQNYGQWNNRRASEALEAARQIWPLDERRPYYDAFLRLYNTHLPALTLFQHVSTYALNQEVNQVEIGRINSPRDRYATFAQWFLLFRDITIICPEQVSG